MCKLEPIAVHQECTENGPCTTVVSGPTDGQADNFLKDDNVCSEYHKHNPDKKLIFVWLLVDPVHGYFNGFTKNVWDGFWLILLCSFVHKRGSGYCPLLKSKYGFLLSFV